MNGVVFSQPANQPQHIIGVCVCHRSTGEEYSVDGIWKLGFDGI